MKEFSSVDVSPHLLSFAAATATAIADVPWQMVVSVVHKALHSGILQSLFFGFLRSGGSF